MSKNAWFACYPQDFLADVGHLGNTELGIYWRLLLVYYRDGRPLPFETDRLRRLAMAFTPEEQKTLEHVLVEFFVVGKESDGTRTWRHLRADRELERSDSIITARQEASRIAHAKRWGALRARKECDSDAKRMPNASQAQCQTPAQPQPQPQRNTNTKPLVDKSTGVSGFDAFWQAYPKKAGKGAARKVFERIKPDAQLQRTMLAAVAKQSTWAQWTKDGGQFIPNPTTWLSQQRWEDEAPHAASSSDDRQAVI